MKKFLNIIIKSKKLWIGPLLFVVIILIITIFINPDSSSTGFNYKLF